MLISLQLLAEWPQVRIPANLNRARQRSPDSGASRCEYSLTNAIESGVAAFPCRKMACEHACCLVCIAKVFIAVVSLISPRGGITLLHIPCNSFASLFVVRFFLGCCEACIVPAFLLTMSMFFTYREQSIMMPIMWAAGNSSPITSGLLSYGVLWIKTGDFATWKWFMRTSIHHGLRRRGRLTRQSSRAASRSSSVSSCGFCSQTIHSMPSF
jgi:hypothetical protein